VSILVEPAKVLFLNNAINHGVFSPLGIEQVTEAGKSIFFLIETNPGPGLGILLAYWVFAKGMIKQSAPGAIIIHFFGGIHEIYFPYILMQPLLILAAIAGGATGVLTFVITKAGLVASPSPGSIFALMAMAPKGELLKVLLGVVLSTTVSFLVASVLIKKKGGDEDGFTDAKDKMVALKGKKSRVVSSSVKTSTLDSIEDELVGIKVIAVACDAGMGSSAMGASKLKAAFKASKIDIKVINCSIDQLDESVNLVITHEKLSARAKEQLPTAIHLTITDFINTDIYEQLAARIREQQNSNRTEVVEEAPVKTLETLALKNIRIGLKSDSKEEAIRMAGQILFEGGYVEEGYIDAMVQRDSELSTFIGNGTAIPHGVSDAKKKIKQTGISVLQFPDGVDFNGNMVYLVVGIAGIGNEHLMILSNLAEIIEDEEKVALLSKTTDVDYIYRQFTN
ncbi:MAG: PTS sugar transporter subunit IIA, partial [Vallitaleaceae bacterium]|nr:PTS sugar transporter subunit IIA [Vallitaleaceae bacterium]